MTVDVGNVDDEVKALLVDFGGVLTTNVFESFRAFCESEGLDPDAVKKIFRERGEGLDLLRQLERGELEVDTGSGSVSVSDVRGENIQIGGTKVGVKSGGQKSATTRAKRRSAGVR